MTVEAHLAELERRHKALEREIESEMTHPGSDDMHVSDLKRRKLLLKDEIARLQKESESRTVH